MRILLAYTKFIVKQNNNKIIIRLLHIVACEAEGTSVVRYPEEQRVFAAMRVMTT